MARTSLVALLLAAGNVAGRALQAADSQEVLQGEGEADDLTQFAFSTAAWLKEVQNDSVTKPQIVPLQQNDKQGNASNLTASICQSLRAGAADAWCDNNCINTPASSFCTLSCHCPGWNAKPHVAQTKAAKQAVACISRNYQLSTDNWCNDNCVEYVGEGHKEECKETCECSEKLKADADASVAKAVAKVKAEAEASPAPDPSGVCKSISEEAPAAWCDKNCQVDPNANWCENSCRCPGYSQAKVVQKCESVSESTPASWCQETCADTPDTKQCALMCHCPGWKAAHVQPLHAPQPVTAAPAPAALPKQDAAPQAVPAPALQPVQQSTKPKTFDKVCKRKIGSSVSADWCDMSCAGTPNSDECKAVCDCPSLSSKGIKDNVAKAECVSSNDLGLGDMEAAALWCDQNCMEDPAAQWCKPCKCPKLSAH